jgi:hypothetical protein
MRVAWIQGWKSGLEQLKTELCTHHHRLLSCWNFEEVLAHVLALYSHTYVSTGSTLLIMTTYPKVTWKAGM